jgi:trans-aconitate 2-methyltransferase
LAPLWRDRPVDEPEVYRDRLEGLCESVEIWETTYHHVLDGKNPVAEGVRSTTLSPLLGALDPKDAEAFLAECAGRLAQAYPPRVDGTTVLAFRRLFVIAGAR